MALDLWCKQDIRNSILAGLVIAAANPDPVLVAGMLIAFMHQAHSFGLDWIPLLQDATKGLGRGGDWLLAVSEGKVLA